MSNDITLPAIRGSALGLACAAEALGMCLFQLLAGSSSSSLSVAFCFAAIQYGTKYLSGGHLNPAVSLAVSGSGHIQWKTGLSYTVAQVLGAIGGALLQALLLPGAHVGKGGAGCIHPGNVNSTELFGWELALTFFFIMVQYSSLFVRPGHGDAAPLASAVTLYAILESAGSLTGHSPVNPARTFASALIFSCWDSVWVYLLAQMVAALLAASWALVAHGSGPHFKRPHNSTLDALLPEPAHSSSPCDTFAPVGKADK